MLLRWVDAFTERPFSGNQAAVCLTKEPRRAAWMQALAAELGAPTTAFVGPLGEGFSLRWFTPQAELELCGHATLAAAHVLWEDDWLDPARPAHFTTRGGRLVARRRPGTVELDLPARLPEPGQASPAMLQALGLPAPAVHRTATYHGSTLLLELDGEERVRSLRPAFEALRRADADHVIVTARAAGGNADFVSRVFAPAVGIDEDAVTGSAHCLLGPYWAPRLGRADLIGRQLSKRGWRVLVMVGGDRVTLGGGAVTVLRATFAGEVLQAGEPALAH
ncbi:MAG: PhzF family phenazine biosynthesis protein [Candidatus Dormibacteraceae bacterium]